MMSRIIFERNLLALTPKFPDVCKRLSAATTSKNRYRFLKARNESVVPAIIDVDDTAKPLHSLIDPQKEAIRLLSTVQGPCYLMLAGLGGGYYLEAALQRKDIQSVLVIDYDIDGIAELIASKDYCTLFQDTRFNILIDPTSSELTNTLLQSYLPILYGGFSLIPLRARTDSANTIFSQAIETIKKCVSTISSDFSVQAHFGNRWLVNTLQNISRPLQRTAAIPPLKNISVIAAGPSLEKAIPKIKERKNHVFILACDTALQALLANDIIPDAVLSIDCQHYSYYHVMHGLPKSTLLFLDISSPPLLSRNASSFRYVSSGHPLGQYITKEFISFPEIDVSGGNVASAAVSLAVKLGAKNIELFGTDFSYPAGQSYARGTYVHDLFQIRQQRFKPLEELHTAFLFRTDDTHLVRDASMWRYETETLLRYKCAMEEMASKCSAHIQTVDTAIDIQFETKLASPNMELYLFSEGKPKRTVQDFLQNYLERLEGLPEYGLQYPTQYIEKLSPTERDVFFTLLPCAANIKRRFPEISVAEDIKKAQRHTKRLLKNRIQHTSTI